MVHTRLNPPPVTNLTPNLPSDFTERDGFPMATVTVSLRPGGSIRVYVEKWKVVWDPIRFIPKGSCGFVGGGYSRSSKDVYVGEATREVTFYSVFGDYFKSHLYCAEGDIEACTGFLIGKLREAYSNHLDALQEQVKGWESCDLQKVEKQ